MRWDVARRAWRYAGQGPALTLLAACLNAQNLVVTPVEAGRPGGILVALQRAEVKTFNPLTALDAPSREVIRRMTADLITIHRPSQKTEPALARSWRVSPDGRRYDIALREGVRFSDGHPFDADDVVFTFRAYLDERVASPQRDLLIIGGQPIRVEKAGPYRVIVRLPSAYAAAERIFDSLAMLPRHLLEKALQDGTLSRQWNLNTAPDKIAGLGPFRLRRYEPGSKVILERNPHYWKTDRQGNPLPYLDGIEFHPLASEETRLLRFLSGEADLLTRVSPRDFDVLQKRAPGGQYTDLGPGLEYNFLFFNLGGGHAQLGEKAQWFGDARFRRAVSLAIDRDAMVRLVYGGHAVPLAGPVTAGNNRWVNRDLGRPLRSLDQARRLLAEAGFRADSHGSLLAPSGASVEFNLAVSSSNPERVQMATIAQDDLRQIGIKVAVTPVEFRTLVDRVLETRQYEACLFGLQSGDADPNPEMSVWLSSGSMHVWNPKQASPATPWEAEIDSLMKRQMVAMRQPERKRLYDRVQRILAEQQPAIFLAGPNILTAASAAVGNFQPAILDHYTLWNADRLFLRRPAKPGTNKAPRQGP